MKSTKVIRNKRRMSSICRFLFASATMICLSIISVLPAIAWDNDVVHPKITQSAINYVYTNLALQEIYDNGFFTIASDSQCSFIDEGSVKEDHFLTSIDSWVTSIWGFVECWQDPATWTRHGYNPSTGRGWINLSGINAVDYARGIWNNALADYKSGERGDAYFKLGRLCHLLEDMSSPGHAQTDVHITGDDAEKWGKANYNAGSYDPTRTRKPSTNGYINMSRNSIENFMMNLAWETYYGSTFQGRLVTQFGDVQPDSELKRMFPGLTYINDWYYPDYWVIPEVGWYFNGIGNSEWWKSEGNNNDGTGYYYLENLDQSGGGPSYPNPGEWVVPEVRRVNFFERIHDGDNLSSKLVANSIPLVELYAANLYPRATEWVAGLLEFFSHSVQSFSIRFMDFEDGVDRQPIRSTIPGLEFTTTQGYDWIFGDWRTGAYNGPYPSGSYTSNGNFFAWLGENQGTGRIDFVGATANSLSVWTSTYSGLTIDAYDSNNNLIANSGWATNNIGTGQMTQLSVSAPNISYILIHDTGNYWLIDDLEIGDLLSETRIFIPWNFTASYEGIDVINRGSSIWQNYHNSTPQTINLILSWNGSELSIRIFSPDGSNYGVYQSNNPPITVTIPNAEIGEWRFEIAAINVPHDNYPFALVVALPDSDADEIPDQDDNCPLMSNRDQTDLDGNGIGDACEFMDITPPAVTILVPSAGGTVQDGLTLIAEAFDASSIVNVYFYIREPGGTDGIPIGYENLVGTFNGTTGKWEFNFNTTRVSDGDYVTLAKAVDYFDNEGWSSLVPFSIKNWAVVKMLPASESNKAGRTMPVKFALRIAASVDPSQPFVYNEQLEIRIYNAAAPGTILQKSIFGIGAIDYRIDTVNEKYITNFKTAKTPATYVVEVWRPSKNFIVGSFIFKTVK